MDAMFDLFQNNRSWTFGIMIGVLVAVSLWMGFMFFRSHAREWALGSLAFASFATIVTLVLIYEEPPPGPSSQESFVTE